MSTTNNSHWIKF